MEQERIRCQLDRRSPGPLLSPSTHINDPNAAGIDIGAAEIYFAVPMSTATRTRGAGLLHLPKT